MTHSFSNKQAALLFDSFPEVNFDAFLQNFMDSAQAHGVADGVEAESRAPEQDSLQIAVAGVQARVEVFAQPCAQEDFALALRAPVLRHKDFDFGAAIRNHRAAIVITVGPEATALPANAPAAAEGAAAHSDKTLDLVVLHLLMQGMCDLCRPSVVSFRPSQLLLTASEVDRLNTLALPVPILFHPFPFDKPGDKGTAAKACIAAIYARKLIGAELELENIPPQMPMSERIELLSALITKKRSGNLLLDDGDQVHPLGSHVLAVRHETGEATGTPHRRIVVSFGDQPLASDVPRQGHQAFQDRIARLKSRRPDHATRRKAPASPEGESAEDLRARVQDVLATGKSAPAHRPVFSGPLKLVAAMVAIGLFFVLGPGGDLTEMMPFRTGSISEVLQGQLVSSGGTTTATTEMVGEIKGAFRP